MGVIDDTKYAHQCSTRLKQEYMSFGTGSLISWEGGGVANQKFWRGWTDFLKIFQNSLIYTCFPVPTRPVPKKKKQDIF